MKTFSDNFIANFYKSSKTNVNRTHFNMFPLLAINKLFSGHLIKYYKEKENTKVYPFKL